MDQNNLIQIFQIDTTKTDAHTALDNLLKKISGLETLEFEKNPNGKPKLKNSDIEFNLSHSGDLAVIAIAEKIPVGIDVQKIQDKTDVAKIARRFFSECESTVLLKIAPEKQRQAFFELWVKKEAIIKARGGKLSEMKNDISDEKEYSVKLFDVGPGYVAAVAAKLAKDYQKYLRKKYRG